MALTVDQFIRRLVDAELFTREELNDILRGLEPRPTDGEQLARELFRCEKLTKYQAQVTYAGDGTPLVLGNYVILERIGAGGMGEVFLAKHQRLERKVALKTLPSKVTDSETAVRRFHREVQAVAKLSHPNIVGAFDAGESNGTHYCVMEYVAGRDLSSIVKEDGPLPADLAIRCIMQSAHGLEYAHAEGVIHRDIKPANLLLDQDGTVKVLDLGLARFEQGERDSGQTELTNTGTVMGTVDYMAPEQAVNTKNADARSDIYSLGCTLFYLLTGRPPYGGETVIEKILTHRDAEIPFLDTGGNDLHAVFCRMVAKNPGDRFQTMDEVVSALQSCLVAEPAASGGVTTAGTDADLQQFIEGIGLPPTKTHIEGPPTSQDTQTSDDAPSDTLNINAGGDTFSLGLTRRPKKTLRDHLSDRTVQVWIGSGLALVVAVICFALFGPTRQPGEQPRETPDGNPPVARQTLGKTNVKKQDGNKVSNSDVDRRVAEWALLKLPNGTVRLDVYGALINVRAVDELEKYIHISVEDITTASAGDLKDDDLKGLLGVTQLKGLRLRHARLLTDRAFRYVGQLTSLERLDVSSSGITSVGLEELKNLKNLKELRLDACVSLYDDDLKLLAVFPHLEILVLGSTRIGDTGWAALEKMPSLRELHINNTQISDAGVPMLAKLTWLRMLDVRLTSLTKAAVEKLHAALPACQIHSEFGIFYKPTQNYALSFDGIDDYVEIPSIDFIPDKAMTIEGRFRPASESTGVRVGLRLHKIPGPLLFHVGGRWKFGFPADPNADQKGRQDLQSAPKSVIAGKQTHLAGVWDGRKLRFYVDGKLVASADNSNPYRPSPYGLRIGAFGDTDMLHQLFSGIIGEIRISRVARYTENFAPAARFQPDKDTIALYHFDEGRGTRLVDHSGNGHHGKIYGATWVNADGSPIASKTD